MPEKAAESEKVKAESEGLNFPVLPVTTLPAMTLPLPGSTEYNHAKEVYMNQALIESNPAVMMGKPVIAGTRITVEDILERLGHGESMEQILEAHPHLKRGDILAALDYAAQALRGDVVYPVADEVA